MPRVPTAGERAKRTRKTESSPPTNGAGRLTDAQLDKLVKALEAARDGDFTVRLRAEGPLAEVASAFNELVERNQHVTKELIRVSKVVGREGRINERASVAGAPGSWSEKIGAVNELVDNLARPTIEVARVIDAVADGDLTQRIQLEIDGQPVRGEFRRIGTTVNAMVDQLSSFAAEVTRVAREVGTEGILGGQAKVKGVSGTWKDLTDSVNQMASNLTGQVRNIADVTTAVANGDLSRKVTVDVKGEVLELKNTVNTMVDQLSLFADEVTRVAREVGTDGKLGGQAQVKGVSGVWKDLTENVNTLANNLTGQVRNIAAVTTAVANGDLSRKITVDVKGEVLELKETVNTMVDQLRSFSAEVTRVAKEVGTEGKLGGQAQVEGVSGVWRDLTENVNTLANNLTGQVRNIAEVTTAVANGDLSKKITVDVRGEVLELKETVNTMVDQLRAFAAEVTRVAREVGTEGKLGGQAQVEGVSGTWRDLTDNVNTLAGNLTSQVRNIAAVTTAVANGDLSKKITVDVKGEIQELKDTINTMVDQLSSFAAEVTRVAREVGTEGKLGGQAQVEGVSGTWRGLTENVNTLANNLTDQVRNIAEVTTAVAQGDLSKKITVDARGEVLELKSTINTMVDQLSAFAAEVTRVAKEVGTEGKLGGQAQVEGVSGTWRGLTENVNLMADNLTAQVRSIAEVTTAVARGDLTQKITIETKGEIAKLASTINTMVDQLSSFAAEVTRVAREVGTEGILGGQATVEGVSGTWRGLTDNVNLLANNLTSQVRAIADVTTAVAKGDLSQKITVDAKGEIALLKGTINTMVDQLSAFAGEVTRVAREVGTEGKLGVEAEVKGVSGVWRDLTQNVNTMSSSLTAQVRNIAEVTTAVANGDLSKKVTVDVKGEILELKQTINTMVDQLSAFAAEVTRVAKEVGTEGKLGGQAQVEGVSGTWRGLTENVNTLANNLTDQVRNIAEVTTAVAQGDLSRKITVEAKGEVAQLASTINTMVDQLSSFAAEVTRVAREVGTEGKLGGQAQVKGVSRDLARPDRQRELHGRLAHRAGAEHRDRDDRGRERRPLEEDHGRREGRDLRAQGHDQHDGRAAARVRLRGDTRGARGRHRGPPRRSGGRRRRVRNLEGPDRERQLHGLHRHGTGAEHRNGDHRGRERRPLEEGHGGREGRGARAQGHDQHDGRPALGVRSRGHPRRPRGRHRGPPGRPGRGGRRLRHLEGPDREREPAREQPHQPGAGDRGRDDCGREGRSLSEDHRRRQGRGGRARGDDQHDGRPALDLRRRGDARGAGGRHRREARRPGAGRRRLRRVEGPDRQRQPAGRDADDAAARDRRRVDGRDAGRPDALDHRRGSR